ncbi:Phosphoglucosamine mutase [Poriferisphaera corsica]|uniref:Phosphoglucosamine mutase n=1 Tax=Poriferisphaera corsica TaxID=2528020 RepID=A0A517YZB9_9BACT|nr:phosphoglucosamine mutase [Poriferisphaera corsica]QDU35513.1 Phosphoglucosamine mutase [Poriferisphaera corsica]
MGASEAPLMLSVSGMRGWVGQSLTPEVVARYGAAFGSWLKESLKSETKHPHVVIGRDSRPSGEMFENAATAGLTSVGCKVTKIGIASTPGVAIMGKHLQADGGVVVTASHNPIIWNGFKALRHDGVAPPADQAAIIIQRFQENDVQYVGVDELQPVSINHSAAEVHVEKVLEHVDIDAIKKAGLHAVVDSVHGAGGLEAKLLLDKLNVKITHLYAEPTGIFPHIPEPTKENLSELASVVKEVNADIGFAQDPDADRLAVIDNNGKYIGEEYTLALCAKHVLSNGDATAANLSTSRMLDDIAAAAGAKVYRSAVGEANVASVMKDQDAIVGGEGNGGIIWSKVIHVRDSLVGMALLCEMLAHQNTTLDKIAESIPAYSIVKDKINLELGMADKIKPTMLEVFHDQRIDTQDGVRVDWPDKWVHARTSNTEPIMRIIAEAKNEKEAIDLINQVRDALGFNRYPE